MTSEADVKLAVWILVTVAEVGVATALSLITLKVLFPPPPLIASPIVQVGKP